eukprot:Em0007g341a
MWVTFHLVCFAVLRKSLEKLEVLYVVTSLLVPVVIVAVPLMTNTYRLSTFHSYCYIYSDNQQIESAERLALWDVPAMVILMAVFIAMLVVMKRVANHLCRRQSYESITSFGGGEVFWRVFKQLLPLTAFPIIFFIFILPALIFHIYAAKNSQSNRDGALIIPAVIFISLWSLASGVTLMIHLLCARRYAYKCVAQDNSFDEHNDSQKNYDAKGMHGAHAKLAYVGELSSNDSHQIELIESLVLWDVPAMVILLAASVAMVTMLGTIAKLLCRKSKYEPLIAGDHFWKVLRHLLPLAAFPILFFICVIPSLIVHIYSMVTTSSNKALEATYLLFISMWSMASGVTLIVHLSVARCLTRKVNIALSQSQTTELHQSSHYS